MIAFTLLALAPTLTFTSATPRQSPLESYDYIVVGAGAGGLTVANRLSEDSDATVLVIEAGPFDAYEDFITIPGLAGTGVGSQYDWNLTYVSTETLGNRTLRLPQGRAVGGTTKINIMTWNHGSQSDYNRWETIGLEGWNWESLSGYFHKSESFTPATPEIAEEYNVTVDSAAHGYSGYVTATYSPFYWPTTRNFVDALLELGIRKPIDPASGDTYGICFSPHNQDPVAATRCSAREAYYATASGRSNFHLISNAQVTRLLKTTESGNVSVSGVEYFSSNNSELITITANREVILSAGAIHTPQILQVSGIGDATLLESINVTTVVDLPAVGQNFHDHVQFGMQLNSSAPLSQANLTTNATYAAEARAQYDNNRTGPYTRSGGDVVGYLPLSTYSSAASTLQQAAAAQDLAAFLAPGTPSEVVEGYRAVHAVLTDGIAAPDSAMVEFGWRDAGMGLTLQQPFSRGSIQAVSSSIFDAPLANPRSMENPLDISIAVEAIRFARTILQTQALAPLHPVETRPGAGVTSDEDLATYVTSVATPAFHAAGSCKMAAREDGGVVDTQLRVHDVANLRVVDASVMPFLPAAHPQRTVYALAEKAADIIRGRV